MLVNAPVVNPDSSSPEAILARNAKRLQVQAEADSKYDTILEGFGCRSQPINTSLVTAVVTVGILCIGAAYFRR